MKIFFNKDLYKKEAIKSAIKEYEKVGLGNFFFKERSNFFIVEGKNIEDEDKTKDELCNFVIGEAKKAGF